MDPEASSEIFPILPKIEVEVGSWFGKGLILSSLERVPGNPRYSRMAEENPPACLFHLPRSPSVAARISYMPEKSGVHLGVAPPMH